MSKKMCRYPSDRKVYVGDLGNSARKNDLEYAFGAFGNLRSVWIARNPPGFAFVEFEDARDAADAVRGLDGRTVCGRRARVELSTGKFNGGGGGGSGGGGSGGNRGDRRGDRTRGSRPFNSDDKCYECGGRGHYARDCRRHGRNRRRSSSRSRSRSDSRSRGNRSHSRSASGSRSRSNSRSRSASVERNSRKSRDTYTKPRENGRGENGDSSRYSNGHNGTGDSISPKRRYNDDSSSSPKRSSPPRRARSISRRRDDSSLSRSRSSSRRD